MKLTTYKATLPGITCDGCIGPLRMVARIQKGIQTVEGRASDKTVSIEYDESEIDEAGIEAWLTRSGYPPAK